MNNRITAMQCDIKTVPLSKVSKYKSVEIREYLYILDEASVLHCLEIDNETLSKIETKEFTGHDLSNIIDDDWSRSHLSLKAVTYNEVIYS